MWFTNGWLRLGSKKQAAQQSDEAAAAAGKNKDDRPYPTNGEKKGARPDLFFFLLVDFPCFFAFALAADRGGHIARRGGAWAARTVCVARSGRC